MTEVANVAISDNVLAIQCSFSPQAALLSFSQDLVGGAYHHALGLWETYAEMHVCIMMHVRDNVRDFGIHEGPDLMPCGTS